MTPDLLAALADFLALSFLWAVLFVIVWVGTSKALRWFLYTGGEMRAANEQPRGVGPCGVARRTLPSLHGLEVVERR